MAKTVSYFVNEQKEGVLWVFYSNKTMSKHKLKAVNKIGRKAVNAEIDIPLASPIVSREHGEIILADGDYYYRDCNSTNGTYINGVLVGRNANSNQFSHKLKDGDILTIDVVNGVKAHPDKVVAIFTSSISAKTIWNKILLNDEIGEIEIGRSIKQGINIQNNMISEKHASFFLAKKGWAIIDHKSTNGVFFNGKRLMSPQYVNPSDVIRIVNTFFIVFEDVIIFSQSFEILEAKKEKKNNANLVINISERSVVQRFKKMLLLQDINISVNNGEMVLILGGSGAGKTTFINAVMGYEKAQGKIVYNDTDIYEEYEQMKYEIGFVPQQDLLRGSDSVYATLSNAAEMKLPKKYSVEDREKRILNVLEELGLSREKNTLVSKLSGGQRKRLSIAVELIANPSLFFLDEPDSGLDDIMGRGLMENLRAIADKGKIIMVITHSPERAAELFDKVIVLAKSSKDNCGHLAFYGSTKESLKFFDVSSFKGIVKKINRPDENGDGQADYYIEKFASKNH